MIERRTRVVALGAEKEGPFLGDDGGTYDRIVRRLPLVVERHEAQRRVDRADDVPGVQEHLDHPGEHPLDRDRQRARVDGTVRLHLRRHGPRVPGVARDHTAGQGDHGRQESVHAPP
jgi:hypothetical protein